MNNRLIFIDLLRSVSVLYIVGFWHLMNYTSAFPGYFNAVTTRITVSTLALFVFLSGYLLGKGFKSGADNLKSFYVNRFLRIYPLYFAALILFYLFHFSGRLTLLKAALLISMIYGPPPPTLWFITMIMMFYLVTPILANSEKIAPLIVKGLSLFVVMAIASYWSPKNDVRLLIYFPAFVSGVFMAKTTHVTRALIATTGIGVLFAFVVSVLTDEEPETSYASMPLAIFSPIAIFLIGKRLNNFPATRVIQHISYAGFVMYLIHRPLYMVMSLAYDKLPPIMDVNMQQLKVGYLMFICLPIVTLLSFFVQKTYDQCLRHLKK